jgi:hypothetical protein
MNSHLTGSFSKEILTMGNNRYVRGMLAVVAALLVANLVMLAATRGKQGVTIESIAQAQMARNTPVPQVNSTVKPVKGYSVDDLKEVISLGDGKTFVVSNPKGFMVYRVEEVQ